MESRFKRSGEQMLSTFFENECFRIQRSQTAGLGAVAIRNLKEGDVILRCRDEPSCKCTAETRYAKDTSGMEDQLLRCYRYSCRVISSGISVQSCLPPFSERSFLI
ncbi:hypothetical protein E4U09_007965 [Claviceps aff. purpurea]|uniref:SET domain-containing protein n=1 Tax=Claviceps aff. purpurea TaxID=1967640 RepID=A0A9P7Q9L9_9HYPO|nr:hypothetical protein E4U09_007965 [Claviceps aff. purpurea]